MGSRSESNRRAWARKKALWEVSPGELVALQKTGAVSESLKACALLAQEEALGLVSALGGIDTISEQRMVLIQDAARLGLVLRAVMARFLQGDGDPELASRVASITSARRSTLQALGLERISKELNLADYLERKAAENGTDGAITINPDSAPAEANASASRGNEGDVLNNSNNPLNSGEQENTQ